MGPTEELRNTALRLAISVTGTGAEIAEVLSTAALIEGYLKNGQKIEYAVKHASSSWFSCTCGATSPEDCKVETGRLA